MIEYGKKYKYKEACEVTENEYKKGGKYQTIYFNNIKKRYDVEKIGMYYIFNRELTELEKLEQIKYNKAKEYIQPILYNALLMTEGNRIELSITQLSKALYMVNNKYIQTKYNLNNGEIEKIDGELIDNYEQISMLSNFIYESSDIIRRIIKDILDDMVDSKLIVYNKVLFYFNKILDNGHLKPVSYKCENETHHIQVEKEVMLNYGYTKDSQIKWNDRKYIKKDVSSILEIEYYYYKYNIGINKIGIEYELENMNYIKLGNSYIYNKLLNSRQGTFKDMDLNYKTKLLDNIIKVNI